MESLYTLHQLPRSLHMSSVERKFSSSSTTLFKQLSWAQSVMLIAQFMEGIRLRKFIASNTAWPEMEFTIPIMTATYPFPP